MFKCFGILWKNIFNYTGRASKREFWLGSIAQMIFMYILALPVGLLAAVTSIPVSLLITLLLVIIFLPLISLYVRRANDVGLSILDTVITAVCVPVVGAMIVGMINSKEQYNGDSHLSAVLRGIMLGMGLFIYGGFFGIVLFSSPGAFLPVVGLGLGLSTVSLIVGYVKISRR